MGRAKLYISGYSLQFYPQFNYFIYDKTATVYFVPNCTNNHFTLFYYLLLRIVRKLHCGHPSRNNRYSQLSRAPEPLTNSKKKSVGLFQNAKASYDFSSNDPYPYPRYTDDWFNSHGTRCAGEVAAARDNDVCGVGVAYDSKVAGIRMLDQPYMTDLIEANSMGHEPDLIDIYSASWGPTDDGKTVDGPRNATMRAIVRGVNELMSKRIFVNPLSTEKINNNSNSDS
ncbi:hypothetical protein E2986_09387 [Frieseomelitta varia]|uniref:Peptidase S8/S53 domain-containing protein n=1 Tax=Frieseomelitta varia TaxID=561572 RepID=A0A833W1L9_9HYME|nr:hypothetical protein E2986_09387 [Frieseomelitta varia]